jgi:tRNA pseudouridine38-40 synthase
VKAARRLKLIVAYDGRPFAGWQSQANANAVQDVLEAAFARVAGAAVRVHGAGRTDAGVHALAQCAHADIETRRLTPDTWIAALNASLPTAIRVVRCAFVSDAFHARFSARGKLYRYRIWNERYLSPFEEGRAWHVRTPLDLCALQRDSADFAGRHDFAGFAANRGKSARRTDSSRGEPEQSTVRTIHSVRVRRRGALITLEFAGDGFLYKMVRLMVGALVRSASGRAASGEIPHRLAQPGASKGGARAAAPACGLYLVRVLY